MCCYVLLAYIDSTASIVSSATVLPQYISKEMIAIIIDPSTITQEMIINFLHRILQFTQLFFHSPY